MDLALQLELFSEALDELDTDEDLTNQVLEVFSHTKDQECI